MNLKSVLESVLFAYGEALSIKKITTITGAELDDIRSAMEEMSSEYQNTGIVLIKKDDTYQLGTHPDSAPYVEKMMKGEFNEELSRAALDTATIIAYKGPITRVGIEFIRGVNSSFTVRNLLMRGLIERVENKNDARSYLYQISADFLKHLGLTRIEDLPRYEEFKKEIIHMPEELSTIEKGQKKDPHIG
jgi:segregation and condensation protein B